MADNVPPGTPKDDLIIVRATGDKIEHFPQHKPAVDFKQTILSSEQQLRGQFDAMQAAAERLRELKLERQTRFPNHAQTRKAEGDERALNDEIVRQERAVEDAAVALVMTLDRPFRTLGDALGQGVDQRQLGGEAYNGVRFSNAVWALSNRQRHIHKWPQYTAEQQAASPEMGVMRALDIDPLAADATSQFFQRCAFAKYEDFQERVLSLSDAVLAGSGIEHDVSPSQFSMRIRFR